MQIEQLLDLIETTKPKNIAIDGRCASGKTTLAEKLHELYPSNLFHMDDFFLRPEQRTKQRYAEPGGNVDRERFKEEVQEALREGKPFSYRPFDCSIMELAEERMVEPKQMNIVEGSYSLHPDLRDFYDLKIFMTCTKEVQIERILKRNPDKVKMFQEKWIPYEESYFQVFKVDEICDYIVDTSVDF